MLYGGVPIFLAQQYIVRSEGATAAIHLGSGVSAKRTRM